MTFIRGDKCELRVLEKADAFPFTEAVNAGLTTEHLFTGSVPMRDADYQQRWEEERRAGDILFAIWLTRTVEAEHNPEHTTRVETFIGTCGIHSIKPVYRSGEVRFLIFDPMAVGKGIGKEVVSLLTHYAFTRMNLHRVWLGVSEDNKRAVKCYLDCGYQFEGRQRDAIFYKGKYHAALTMAVLEDEWKSIAG